MGDDISVDDFSADYFSTAFGGTHVMAIFRGLDPAGTVRACQEAWDLGIDVVEIPVQTPDAMPSLRAAIDAARERGRTVGAGTVLRPEQVRDVAAAGAAFTVAPGTHVEAIAVSRELRLPHLPGVATSTDIAQALALGFTWLKAFPASELGPGWIRAQRGPFPQVKFVATGGITPDTMPAMLEAGCVAVAGTAVAAFARGRTQR
jgi:2-dehydro-3-deoxyphosphogluconate aldolase / (4S)-4-hydroxy-2-oxoglutarate aldolase